MTDIATLDEKRLTLNGFLFPCLLPHSRSLTVRGRSVTEEENALAIWLNPRALMV